MRSRWVRWTLGACALLTSIVAVIWFAMPFYVRTRLLPELWGRYGLTVTAEREGVSIADGTAELSGVRILDGNEELLTAKHLEVEVSLRGLYEGRTLFERVVLDDPVVHVRLEPEGRTNIGRILGRPTASQAAPGPATLWKQVFVHGGRVEWDDPTNQVSLRFFDVEARIFDVQTGSGERQDRFGQITIDGKLAQASPPPAPLSIVSWTTSSGSAGPAFVAHAALTAIDLDSFPGYVDATQRASLGVDHLDLVVSMDVREGIIHRGAAVAVSPERTRPLVLLFGGPVADPVFDRSSRLIALWEVPFSRLGRLGDVVWETGGAVVGGAIGVIDGLIHGDLLGAGASAIGGVGGGVFSIGSNTLDAIEAIGRRLGLVAPAEARDTAKIHDHQRTLFLTARREAAQAWSSTPSGARAEAHASGAAPEAGRDD